MKSIDSLKALRINLNSKEYSFKEPISIHELLLKLNFNLDSIALECNKELVVKNSWKDTMIKDGDEFIVVEFVGGG